MSNSIMAISAGAALGSRDVINPDKIHAPPVAEPEDAP